MVYNSKIQTSNFNGILRFNRLMKNRGLRNDILESMQNLNRWKDGREPRQGHQVKTVSNYQ